MDRKSFLEWLNSKLIVCDGQIRPRLESEKSHADLFESGSLIFAVDVDYVWEGPCSTEPLSTDPEAPLGRFTLIEGEKKTPEVSYFHHFFQQHPDAKNILVYPGCCGTYRDDVGDTFRRLKPEVNWILPEMCDLCSNLHIASNVASLAIWLEREGILAVQP